MGFDVNERDRYARVPLHYAAELGRLGCTPIADARSLGQRDLGVAHTYSPCIGGQLQKLSGGFDPV